MMIAIMQPTYLPWLGYFELMARSEHFVLFDDVQFVRKSWQQRNRIKSPAGELLLAVPVKTSGARFQNINEVLIDNTQTWAKKHLRSVEFNYARAPHLGRYLPGLRDVYSQNHLKLLDLNRALIEFLKEQLHIRTPLMLSSAIPARAPRNEKIIDICRHLQADVLYDPLSARELLDLQQFAAAGVTVRFQEYHHPQYSQLFGTFLPYMSVLDLLLNEGERALEILLSGAGPENKRPHPTSLCSSPEALDSEPRGGGGGAGSWAEPRHVPLHPVHAPAKTDLS
jgi:hypothetical protein